MKEQSTTLASRELPLLPHQPPLAVLIYCDDRSANITRIRLGAPLLRLAADTNKIIKFSEFRSANRAEVEWCDIIVIQRAHSRSVVPLVAYARSLGKPVIYEIDDLLTEIPSFLKHHKGYVKNKKSIIRLLQLCDAVTVTQPRLRDALLPLNSNIFICPNYANASVRIQSPGAMHTEDGTATLVMASSDRVRVDFLIPALEQLQETYADKIKLIIIGNLATGFMQTKLKYETIEILPIEQFVQFVAQQPNAIGLIPLDDSKFSSCKSAIKYFDYTQAGASVICSNFSPYRDVILHDHNGVLTENTTAAWTMHISRQIDNAPLRRELVNAAQRSVAEHHNIEITVQQWHALFESIAPGNLVAPLQNKKLDAGTRFALFMGKISEMNRQRRIKRKQGKLLVR